MKNIRLLLSGLLIIILAGGAKSQDSTHTAPTEKKNKHKSTGKPVWIIGVHGVVIDDDGNAFGDLFNVGNSWQFLPYPTRITVERSLDRAWRLEASLAYSKSESGKVVNDRPAFGSQPFFAFDINAKYDLNALFGETSVFDPYTVSGLGFTHRSTLFEVKKNTPTVNLGLGFNVWIYKGIGINLQTSAKFKLNMESSNYLMHSAGLVYRFNSVEKEPASGTIREVR